MQNPTTGLTDISNLPADRVKPQEGKFEQSASQSSTMQSVDHENTREQMPQGSLEHLNAEPSLISQGVEAVKEFAHKAAEKIEGLFKSAAPEQKDAKDLKDSVAKRAYLVRKSASRKLGKRSDKLKKEAGLASGIAKVYGKEEYKNLRRKADRFGRDLRSRKVQKGSESDFSSQLREGASSFRREARRLLNELPRQAEMAKQSLLKEGEKPKAGEFSEASPSKFLVEFSSQEMNGRAGKFRTLPAKRLGFGQDFSGKSSEWSTEVSAHDWNESCSTANKYIGFLMDKARDYGKRASKQATFAQRRFTRERRNIQRGKKAL